MAQLSDDCFAHGRGLLTVEEAGRLLEQGVLPVSEMELVPLRHARGRVLAEDLLAGTPLPRFTNSAVDGYALRFDDLQAAGEEALTITGRVAAGAESVAPLPLGAAARIFTGAPLPSGADTVLMQEDARVLDGKLLVPTGLTRGRNIRVAGEDLQSGAVALRQGRLLDPRAIALAAALGLSSLKVRRRLKIGVFSTGDELGEPGDPLHAGHIYDSNRYMLIALLERYPAEITDLGILPDRQDETERALWDAAPSFDMLITSGGVSTGEEDHLRSAIEAVGRLVFWRLAIKPGRPVALGMIGETPVMGLPGNPAASLVTFLHLARPMVLRLAGATSSPLPRIPALAAFHYAKKPGRQEYLRVTLEEESGAMRAQISPKDGAAFLATLAQADALAEIPGDCTTITPGSPLRVIPLGEVL
ncbi:molybdopterin molybdotransferase MoeA [Acetobacteraceae bacterium H6797]|nr:molybdopterin molybdotransferase MoeA [Acetobacteraceae bacterium H6797]